MNLFLTVLEKNNTFNDFFSQQCQPISNESVFHSSWKYHTDERLNYVNFTGAVYNAMLWRNYF